MSDEFCPVPSREAVKQGLQRGTYIMTDLGLERRCPECDEYWPQTTEFWALSARNPGGVQAWCKGCHSAHNNANNKERRRIRGPLPGVPRKPGQWRYERADGLPTAAEIANETGLAAAVVKARRQQGWPDDRIRNTPSRPRVTARALCAGRAA